MIVLSTLAYSLNSNFIAHSTFWDVAHVIWVASFWSFIHFVWHHWIMKCSIILWKINSRVIWTYEIYSCAINLIPSSSHWTWDYKANTTHSNSNRKTNAILQFTILLIFCLMGRYFSWLLTMELISHRQFFYVYFPMEMIFNRLTLALQYSNRTLSIITPQRSQFTWVNRNSTENGCISAVFRWIRPETRWNHYIKMTLYYCSRRIGWTQLLHTCHFLEVFIFLLLMLVQSFII